MSNLLRACLLAVAFAMPLASRAATTDLAGNALSGVPYTSGQTYILDNVAPTATITVATTSLKVGSTSTVTIVFSEAVTGFTNADLTVANGTLSTVSTSDNITFTATLTPNSSVSDATNVITLANSGVTDAVGNAGSGTTTSNNYAIDTVRPTATIAVATTPLKIGATSGVTITFSEAVSGFTNADLTIENGTLSAVSSSDGGTTWTATLTPATTTSDSTNVITLDNTGVTDGAGNAGSGTTTSNNYAVDTVRPTATITVATTPIKAGATSAVTITFSEAVTGFTNADLTVSNGTLSTVSTSNNLTFTATFTPSTSTTAATNVITLDNTGVTDAAGNAGSGTTDSNNFAIDTAAPSAPSTPDLAAGSDTGASSTDDLTKTTTPVITGTGEVGATVTLYDTDGTTSLGTATVDGSGNWSITTSTLSGGAHTLTAKQVDVAGNASVASGGLAITIDTTAPSASSSVRVDATPTKNASVQFTVTFSEAVTGVDNGDFTLTTNGTLAGAGISAVSGSGTTYTVTVDTGTGSGQLRLNVAANGTIVDAAGNALSGAFTSGQVYVIDRTAPTISSITRDTTAVVNTTATTVVYRVTFSEDVSAVTADDFAITTVSGTAAGTAVGTVTAVTTTKVYTVEVTGVSGLGVLRLDLKSSGTGIADLAGNLLADGGYTSGDYFAIGDTNVFDSTVIASSSTRNVAGSGGLKVAQRFTTSASEPLTLFNVAAHITTVVGTPVPVVTLQADASGAPGSVIATLTNPASLVAGRVNLWTTATVLQPSTTYWLVFDDTSASAVYGVGYTAATTGGSGGWLGAGDYNLVSYTPGATPETGALRLGLGAVSVPTISSVTPPANGAYRAGTNLDFTVNYNFSVTVTGTPTLPLTIGATGASASYLSGSPGTALVFRYTVQAGDTDTNGIATASPLVLSGGTIKSAAAVDAQLSFNPPTTTGVIVDTSVTAPTGLALASGSNSGSTSDTLTNDTTPTITGGGAEAGATVALYDTDGTTSLGTTTADGSGNWSITPGSAIAAGAHTLTAKQTDLAGNVSAASNGLGITIDDAATAPTGLDLIAASDSGSSNTDNITSAMTPTISGGGAESGATVTLYDTNGTTVLGTATANGSGSWSITSSTLGAGAHTLTAKQTDPAANTSAASAGLAITVDVAAAAPSGLALATASNSGSTSDTLTNATTPTVTGGGAESGATVTLYDTNGTTALGTATADGSGNWSVASSTLTAGAHTLTAKQVDVAGNQSAASSGLTVTIDTTATAPTGVALDVASNSGSTSDALTNDTTPTITGGGAESGATVTLYDTDGTTVLGTATANGSGNWTITSSTLADGAHTLTAKQTDLAANTSPASSSLTITIDATVTAPNNLALAAASNSGSTSDTLTNVTTPTINGGGAEVGATVTLYNGSTALGTATADGSGNWSITPGAALAAGAYTLTAKQTDLAANTSAASAGLALTIDTSASAPTGLALATASNSGSTSDTLTKVTTPTITGGGAEVGATVTLYDTNGTTALGTATADGSGNWSIASSTLSEGAHTLTAKQTDLAANVSAASTSLTITIDTTAPAVPASLDLIAASDSGASSTDNLTNVTTPTITGTADANNSVTLYDTDGTTALGTVTADGSGNWSITTSTLAAGAHTLTAKQTDAAANVSVSSSSLTITIDTSASAPTGLDLNAASDSGIATDNITTDTTPTIDGGGAEAGAAVTLYDTNGTTVLGTATADGSGNWSITATALSDGAHTLTAKQVDLAGNTSAASTSLVVTIDTTAPTVASLLRQTPNTVNTGAATVTWRVTFAESVTGVDASDFTLTVVNGTASGTIGTVTSVSASVYDVAVTSVAGQGRLRLDLKASGTGIADVATNAIGAGGFATGDFYLAGVENVFQTTLLSSDGLKTVSTAGGVAQRFTTAAAAPLSLTTVSAALGAVNAATPVVEVREDNAGAVGALVTTLTNPASLTPNALNVWSSTQLLTANKTYWVVFTATAGDYVIKNTDAVAGGLGTWLNAPADYVYRTGATLVSSATGALQVALGATSTPTITSPLIASGTYGAAFGGYTATATNLPTSFGATGLPSGLTLNPTTGVISGTPSAAGTFNVALTGTNTSGTGVPSTLVLTIAKAVLTVTAQPATRAYLEANPPFTVAYSGFLLGDTASVLSTPAKAETNAPTNSPVGTYPLSAGGGAADNYTFSYVASVLTITKAVATVTVNSLTVPYDGTAKSVTANTTPPGLAVTLSYAGLATAPSAPGTYTVSGTIVDANYQGSGTGSLVIGKAPATIAFGNLSFTYDGTAKATTATTTPAGLAVTLTYDGSATAPTNAGAYTVEATATGPNNAGSATATLTIAKATQTVTFNPLGSLNSGVATTLSATASSGLPVTFSVVSGPATINGAVLTPTGGGNVVVRAAQAGNANYLPASADRSGTVASKLPQTIDFPGIASRLSTEPPFQIVARTSSGLPVVFKVISGPAILVGDIVILTGAGGTVTIVAMQPGNAAYDLAPEVYRSFEVTDAGTDTFFGDLLEDDSALGNVGALSRPVAASVSDEQWRSGAAGEVSIAAGKAGDIAAAITANTRNGSLLIVAPSINLNVSLDFTVDADGSYTIPFTSAGRTLSVTGSVLGGTLTGRIPTLKVRFTTQVLPRDGATAAYAGVYKSSAVATTQGSTVSIVGSTGQALVLAMTPMITTGGLTQVKSDGTFALTTSTATISGTVDAPTATVSGAIKVAGMTEVDYSGLKNQVQRTDRLFNLSSRSRVGADGTTTVITGFVIGGTSPKTLLLRAAGPSLTQFGVNEVLANPRLRLFDGKGQLLRENDDWSGSDVAAAALRTGAFGFTAGSKDAAMLVTLDPGAYTVHVLDGGGTGVALAEIYDASMNPQGEYQRLINISSRGVVTAGEGVLIGGFVITGNSPKRVLIRGTGPALAAYGVPDVLANPMLKLYSQGEVIAQNDDWEKPLPLTATQTAATAAEITAANTATGAFALTAGAKDAALIVTLAPGVYTAQVTGVGGATGGALVEIYEIP